jgi:hypothetical protein
MASAVAACLVRTANLSVHIPECSQVSSEKCSLVREHSKSDIGEPEKRTRRSQPLLRNRKTGLALAEGVAPPCRAALAGTAPSGGCPILGASAGTATRSAPKADVTVAVHFRLTQSRPPCGLLAAPTTAPRGSTAAARGGDGACGPMASAVLRTGRSHLCPRSAPDGG